MVDARPHPDDALLDVHDRRLVEFLQTAWERWDEAGYPVERGQSRVVSYIYPHPGLMDGLEPARPDRALGAARATSASTR